MPPDLVDVAALAPVEGALTYRIPAGFEGLVRAGSRVIVPLGSRTAVGVVLGPAGPQRPGPMEIRAISDVLDDGAPIVEAELLDLLRRAAAYYAAPLGEVLRAALPAALQAREQESLRLTEAGEQALANAEAILRRPGEDLPRRDLEILRLVAQRKRGISRRQLRSHAAVLARLVDRGLITRELRRKAEGAARRDYLVEVRCPAAEPVELSRAPRQAALLDAIRRAGGRVRLAALRDGPAGSRELARKLAAKGLVFVEEVEVPRDPFAGEVVPQDAPHAPTEEQRDALEALRAAVRAGGYRAFLLHGVTSSGKTEVYLQLIADALARDRTALVLVPEIALTPQLAARFRARFGDLVAVLHSGLTDAERLAQWRRARSGQVRIVVGARSAVFAPLSGPGVIIVDEEHDGSFKQEEGVRYNARDLALLRASRCGAVAVLGSATPSLESRYGAEQGRLGLLVLRHRATPQPLPEVEVIDLRVHATGTARVLSGPLAAALEETLDRGEQAILFLNRRGFSPFVICRACGHVFRCEHCSVSLTHHRRDQRLLCHYCGFARATPTCCPQCRGSESIGMLGLGTERVERHIAERFPGARVSRLDRDVAAGKRLRAVLAQFGRREVDILVGTQMVTKGHDFPRVTLVGVVCADLGLHFPDFRAAERTFQLLAQVAGRAGRGTTPGRVLLQTYNPEHPSIRYANVHDYEGFYREELRARRELGYPPFAFLAALRVDGTDGDAVARIARAIADDLRPALRGGGVIMLGPAEAPIQRLKGRSRWLLLLKARRRADLRRVIEPLAHGRRGTGKGIRVTVDVDPVNLL